MNWIFPTYELKLKKEGEHEKVWDIVRKRWFVNQPEEEVRQHLLHYLIQEKKINPSLIGVEKEIRYLRMKKRFDVVIFDKNGKPFILIECKAPSVQINQDTLNQIARYNTSIQAPHLLLTNGVSWMFFSRQVSGSYAFQPSGWLDEDEKH